MRTRLTTLRQRLALWLYPIDEAALARLVTIRMGARAHPLWEHWQALNKPAQDQFLADIAPLKHNNSFQSMLSYLGDDQVVLTAKTAESMEQVNFGRATLNAYELLRLEIDEVESVFKERHKLQETFDPQQIFN